MERTTPKQHCLALDASGLRPIFQNASHFCQRLTGFSRVQFSSLVCSVQTAIDIYHVFYRRNERVCTGLVLDMFCRCEFDPFIAPDLILFPFLRLLCPIWGFAHLSVRCEPVKEMVEGLAYQIQGRSFRIGSCAIESLPYFSISISKSGVKFGKTLRIRLVFVGRRDWRVIDRCRVNSWNETRSCSR